MKVIVGNKSFKDKDKQWRHPNENFVTTKENGHHLAKLGLVTEVKEEDDKKSSKSAKSSQKEEKAELTTKEDKTAKSTKAAKK